MPRGSHQLSYLWGLEGGPFVANNNQDLGELEDWRYGAGSLASQPSISLVIPVLVLRSRSKVTRSTLRHIDLTEINIWDRDY